eukprot:gene1008-3838_t
MRNVSVQEVPRRLAKAVTVPILAEGLPQDFILSEHKGGALTPCSAAGAASKRRKESGRKLSYIEKVLALMYEELWPDKEHLDQEFQMHAELKKKGMYRTGNSKDTLVKLHKKGQVLMRVKGRKGIYKFTKPRPEHGSPEFIKMFGESKFELKCESKFELKCEFKCELIVVLGEFKCELIVVLGEFKCELIVVLGEFKREFIKTFGESKSDFKSEFKCDFKRECMVVLGESKRKFKFEFINLLDEFKCMMS